jgi:hypothetical protein
MKIHIKLRNDKMSSVRLRKRKASQPEKGRQDSSRDSEGFDGAGNGLEVRQSRVSTILHRSVKDLAAANSSLGNTGRRDSSHNARPNMNGLATIHNVSDQRGTDNAIIGRKVSHYFSNFPEC